MSHEIVPVDRIDVPNMCQEHDSPEPFDSESVPATLGSGIQRFLRIANLIESEEPRIAYLCRFYAFEIAHKRDRQASGRGVRQFRTSLLKRLEQDNEFTLIRREMNSDAREVKRVYHTYKEYIIRHGAAFNVGDSQREKLIKARIIASALYEVLKAVTSTADDPQATEDRESIREISEVYVPYNILRLDKGKLHKAVMHLPDMAWWGKQIVIIAIYYFVNLGLGRNSTNVSIDNTDD